MKTQQGRVDKWLAPFPTQCSLALCVTLSPSCAPPAWRHTPAGEHSSSMPSQLSCCPVSSPLRSSWTSLGHLLQTGVPLSPRALSQGVTHLPTRHPILEVPSSNLRSSCWGLRPTRPRPLLAETTVLSSQLLLAPHLYPLALPLPFRPLSFGKEHSGSRALRPWAEQLSGSAPEHGGLQRK